MKQQIIYFDSRHVFAETWHFDAQYKYEDDFFLDEGGEYGMDMDYYYDDYGYYYYQSYILAADVY